MSITNYFNDPRSATFLVAGGDQALQTSPSAVAPVSIDDYANDAVNIADLQLGVLIKDEQFPDRYNTFLVAGELASDFSKIQLVQGTPYSSNVSLVDAHRRGHQSYVKSNDIDANGASLSVVSKPFTQSKSSAWVLGDVAGSTGEFLPLDNVIYPFRIGFGGRKSKKRNSQSGVSRMFVNMVKESITYTNDVDRFLQRTAASLNVNSSLRSRGARLRHGSKPGIVFAMNLVGGAGTPLSDFVVGNLGNQVPYEIKDGRTLTIEITEDLIATVAEMIAVVGAQYTAASTIEVIDLSTAGSVAMAAGAAAADALMFLALDDERAVVDDRVESVKTLIEKVGTENFPNLKKTEASRMYRGQGRGWQLFQDYQRRALMEIFAEETFPQENRPASLPPVYFSNDDTKYNVHEVWHSWAEYKDVQRIERNNQVVILEPIADTTTKASLNAVLAPWLNSVSMLKKFTDATAPSLFI